MFPIKKMCTIMVDREKNIFMVMFLMHVCQEEITDNVSFRTHWLVCLA